GIVREGLLPLALVGLKTCLEECSIAGIRCQHVLASRRPVPAQFLRLPDAETPGPAVEPSTHEESVAVRAESHAMRFLHLPAEREGFLARLRVPDLDGAIDTGGGQASAIAVEGHGRHGDGMALRGEDRLARRGDPDPHGLVVTAGSDAVPLSI